MKVVLTGMTASTIEDIMIADSLEDCEEKRDLIKEIEGNLLKVFKQPTGGRLADRNLPNLIILQHMLEE